MICDKVSIFGLLVVSATISSISCSKNGTFKSVLVKDIECSNGMPNYHYYPYDCKKYFGCVGGVVKELTCPSDLYWNDFVKACDVHEETDCAHIIPFPNPDCSDGRTTYNLYPYDCSKFWECYEKTLRLMVCPISSLWNDKIKACDERGSVDCSHIIPYPDSTPAPPVTPTRKTTTSTPDITYSTPEINCAVEGSLYPNPYDCTKYYECAGGHSILMDCPDGLYFNDVLKICDYFDRVDCSRIKSTSPRPPTPSTTTTPTYTTPKIDCTYDNTYFPYPYDCAKFYECSSGHPVLMDCDLGTVWNDAIKNCDYPYNVDCSYVISTPRPFYNVL